MNPELQTLISEPHPRGVNLKPKREPCRSTSNFGIGLVGLRGVVCRWVWIVCGVWIVWGVWTVYVIWVVCGIWIVSKGWIVCGSETVCGGAACLWGYNFSRNSFAEWVLAVLGLTSSMSPWSG